MQRNSASEIYMRNYINSIIMGVPGLVPGIVQYVYDELLLDIWRASKGSPSRLLCGAHKSGLLMCRVSQSKVAANLGLTGRSVRRHIATLKSLGWLRIHEDSTPRVAQHYVVGTVFFPPPYEDENGNMVTPRPKETTFKDAAVLKAMKEACVYGDVKWKPVRDLPLAVRHEFLKKYFVPVA